MQIILPALNEENGIAFTIAELRKYLGNPEILVVDGKSKDKTVDVAKSLGAVVIFQDGIGKGDALKSALKNLKPDSIYVVLTDADYTYPAEFIPEMTKILYQNPDIGMVCGNRFNSVFPLDVMNKAFYFGNKLITIAHTVLNGVSLSDPLTGLRVIKADVIKNWIPASQDFDVEVELNNYVKKKGFGIKEVPIFYRQRIGEKKLKMRHGINILKRILFEGF